MIEPKLKAKMQPRYLGYHATILSGERCVTTLITVCVGDSQSPRLVSFGYETQFTALVTRMAFVSPASRKEVCDPELWNRFLRRQYFSTNHNSSPISVQPPRVNGN